MHDVNTSLSFSLSSFSFSLQLFPYVLQEKSDFHRALLLLSSLSLQRNSSEVSVNQILSKKIRLTCQVYYRRYIWLKNCRYGVKHYPISQSINQTSSQIINQSINQSVGENLSHNTGIQIPHSLLFKKVMLSRISTYRSDISMLFRGMQQ